MSTYAGPVIFRRTLQGPEATIAAEALRQERDSKQQWPYPWIYPPPGATRVQAGADASGTIVAPVLATPTQGLAYTVDEGFQFALTHLVVIFINSTTANQGVAPGAFLWSLTVNQPVGVTTFQGSPVQGFASLDVPLGNLVIPWPLEMPELFQPNDTVRSVFTNVSLGVGAPNYLKTILLGWKWPALPPG
jgi:hypothetical protein